MQPRRPCLILVGGAPASGKTTLARFRARQSAGERHPVHTDVAELEHHLAASTFDPLDLPWPTLRVDTADGFRPSRAEIVRWVRAATEKRAS